jgi:hypothetical protein
MKRCDRCGRYENDEDAVEIQVDRPDPSLEGDEQRDETKVDLCESCDADLAKFLTGTKLSTSERKVRAS